MIQIGETTAIFSIVAAIILLGFAGEQFFRKTGTPYFLFLIAAGILLGPVLGVISSASLLPILGTLAVLTLLMVLFYGGMDIKLKALFSTGGRAFVQTFIYVGLGVLGTTLFLHYILNWDFIDAMIFGTIVGGETTAAVIIPLSRSLKLKEKTIVFLTLESSLNSVILVVLFFTFLGLYQTGSTSILLTVESLASQFSTAIVIGIILSLIWIYILNRVKKYKYTYILTLGFLFLTYSISQTAGGSGLLSVLIFGIVLGNHSFISSLLRRKIHMEMVEKQLSVFQEELSFLLRTLFFVFLGLIFTLSMKSFIYGASVSLALLLILLLMRGLAVSVSTFRSELSTDKKAIFSLCAQGLTPATLAILSLSYGIPRASTFIVLVTYVIIFTSVVTTVGSFIVMRGRPKKVRDTSLRVAS